LTSTQQSNGRRIEAVTTALWTVPDHWQKVIADAHLVFIFLLFHVVGDELDADDGLHHLGRQDAVTSRPRRRGRRLVGGGVTLQ